MHPSFKVVIITGAGSDIGEQTALVFLHEGYAVVLAGRCKQTLERSADEAGDSRSRALMVFTDVTDPEFVRNLFARAKESLVRLDILFNNAGIFGRSVPLEDVPDEGWKAAVDTNLSGYFLCTQQAFMMMKSQQPKRGRIINNGSISAHALRPNTVSYSATKHAITGLTKSTSLEGCKYDIACGQIDIGNAATDMTEVFQKGFLQPNGSIAPEPMMDTAEVARSVLCMASLPLSANVHFLTVMRPRCLSLAVNEPAIVKTA